MKLKSSLCITALLFSFLLASCGQKNESVTTTSNVTEEEPNQEITMIDSSLVNRELQTQSKPKITVDASIGGNIKDKLDYDMSNIQKLWIEAADNGSFAKIFNGTSQRSIVNYLNTRLHYVLPELGDSDIDSRLITSDTYNASPFAKGITMASNLGVLLWLDSLSKGNGLGTDVYSFRINNKPVSVDSSRVGIVMLGPGYSLGRTNTADRISTLIHESRHSDCTGGLTMMDRQLLKNGELPESLACGHLHVKCPPGHPLAGVYACDQHQWGAYSIEWIFNAGMVKYCKNCTPEAKEVARISGYDSVSRLLFDHDRMVRNTPPDMTSATY